MENVNAVGKSSFIEMGEDLRKDDKYIGVVTELALGGKSRVIMDRVSHKPYLMRYYYQNFRPFARIVIHNFLQSDVDGLHDHPWGFQTYILAGGYWEVTKEGRTWRGVGDTVTANANYFHRVELDHEKAGGPTWTLFMMGQQEKDWGFLDKNDQWVQWEEYLYGG